MSEAFVFTDSLLVLLAAVAMGVLSPIAFFLFLWRTYDESDVVLAEEETDQEHQST